jgi:2-polyprenyl-6-methoxyphenol hydroxylase-like FAD-dependent oxidoreductase
VAREFGFVRIPVEIQVRGGRKAVPRRLNGRAVIIGGSMSGLLTGILLGQAGWDVDIYERHEIELAGRGAGIVTHPELWEALEEAGLAPVRDHGVDVQARKTLDRSGTLIGERPFRQTFTSWERLFQILRAAFPPGRYHLAKGLRSVEQQGQRVVANFADGSRAEGDLLVGADGLRSTVRAQYLPDVAPDYAGYVAWRGLVAESALSETTHRDLFGHLAFCLPPGEQMLGYPVAGPGNDLRAGRRRYNFVWYRPAAEETDLRRLLTDKFGQTHAVSIAPPLIHPDVIREMRLAAEALLAPQFAETVHRTDQPFLQPIYDVECRQMVFGRVALLGDAAFVARPHVGAGIAKATRDALALARSLQSCETVEAALLEFEASRLPIGRRVVKRARRLGAGMRSKHRTVEAVMAETAALDFHDA